MLLAVMWPNVTRRGGCCYWVFIKDSAFRVFLPFHDEGDAEIGALVHYR